MLHDALPISVRYVNIDLRTVPISVRYVNPTIKKVKRMFWLRFVFESYFELDDDVWGKHGCISKDCDCFVSEDILLSGWQAGVKNVFVYRFVGLCINIWYFVDRADIQHYILRGWQAGSENVFECRIIALCRSVWCCVERSDIQRYIMWKNTRIVYRTRVLYD